MGPICRSLKFENSDSRRNCSWRGVGLFRRSLKYAFEKKRLRHPAGTALSDILNRRSCLLAPHGDWGGVSVFAQKVKPLASINPVGATPGMLDSVSSNSSGRARSPPSGTRIAGLSALDACPLGTANHHRAERNGTSGWIASRCRSRVRYGVRNF